MARENPTSTPTGILTFLGGVILLVVFAALTVQWIRTSGVTDDIAIKRAEARRSVREQLGQKHREQLESLAWTDKTKGIARVPIKEAMALSLAELKSKKVAASTVKVEPLLVMPAPDPNSTEPPPMSLPSAPGGATLVQFPGLASSQNATAKDGAKAAPAGQPQGSAPGVPSPTSAPAPSPSVSPAVAPAPGDPAKPEMTPAAPTGQAAPAPTAPSSPGSPKTEPAGTNPPGTSTEKPMGNPASGSTAAPGLPAGTTPPAATGGAVPEVKGTPGANQPAGEAKPVTPGAPVEGDGKGTPDATKMRTSEPPNSAQPSTPNVVSPAPVPGLPTQPAPSASQAAPPAAASPVPAPGLQATTPAAGQPAGKTEPSAKPESPAAP